MYVYGTPHLPAADINNGTPIVHERTLHCGRCNGQERVHVSGSPPEWISIVDMFFPDSNAALVPCCCWKERRRPGLRRGASGPAEIGCPHSDISTGAFKWSPVIYMVPVFTPFTPASPQRQAWPPPAWGGGGGGRLGAPADWATRGSTHKGEQPLWQRTTAPRAPSWGHGTAPQLKT